MHALIAKLNGAGLKATKPRLAILKELSRRHSPASARELHGLTGEGDLASVYRSLKALEETNLVHAETAGRERVYCLAGEPHHHITCRQCGLTESFPCEHQSARLRGFTDLRHQMTVTGICRGCRAKRPE